MAVGLVVILAISFGLLVGWHWYFGEIESRRTIIDLAAREEARVSALGMGIPKVAMELPEEAKEKAPEDRPDALPLTSIAPGKGDPRTRSNPVPAASKIQELPISAIENDFKAAESLLARYWGARSWQQRLSLVRQSDRVKPLMQTYYEGQGGSDPMPGALRGKGRFLIDQTEVLHFSFDSARANGVLEVALVRDTGGAFRIDWESCVGYGDKTFVQMRLQRPTEPIVLRVMAKLDDYYNFEFDDPEVFVCTKLASPDGGYSLFGYARRDSEVGQWLERELVGQGVRGLALEVAYPANAQSDQCLEIRRVLADRWLLLP
jgi:hypothetical protein